MEYLLHVADSSARHMTVLTLSQGDVQKSAIDVVFDFLGNENPQELVEQGVLPEGQINDFTALQRLVFDKDDQGLFIREDINLKANGSDLNPDATIAGAFKPAQRDGVEYRRCDISISGGALDDTANGYPIASNNQSGSVEELARLMFLHQIAIGKLVDVTKELAELTDIIKWAETEGLIEIDVEKVAYKLTEKGKRRHDSYMEEGQNLVIRYDIFGDVDIDSAGKVFFDTGHGKDLRVPIYELEGIDPYRARFVLGLNDGEWNSMDDWSQRCTSEEWYHEIFEPIDHAPSVENISQAQLTKVLEAGKQKMREEAH
jgi:hypothetical protein